MIKDWKKVKGSIAYKKNGVGEVYVNAYSLGVKGSTYAVFIEYPNQNEEVLRANFKSKNSATKWMRAYMRKH